MSSLRKFFAVLFRGQPIERAEDALTAEFEAAQTRLHTAQSDFARVVREVLDQNERLRALDGKRTPHSPNPRS